MATLKESIKYSFANFPRTFNWYIVAIPVWGWFVAYGYILRVINEVVKGKKKELPSLTPFDNLFSEGFVLFALSMVLGIISIILIFIPILGWLALFYLMLIYPILFLQFAESRKFADGLNILRASKTFVKHLGDYFVVILKSLAIYIPVIAPYYIVVLGFVFTGSLWWLIPMFVVIIGLLILAPALMFSVLYLWADFWRSVKKK